MVFKLGELFEKKGFSELLRLILMLVQEVLYHRIYHGKDHPFSCFGAHKLIQLSHNTVHDWVMQTDCDEIKLSSDVIGSMGPVQVVADGTGFKGQP